MFCLKIRDMKQVLAIVVVLMFAACKEEAPVDEFALKDFEFSGCNFEKSTKLYSKQSVEYRYGEGNLLHLKHVDVYFNCCQPENNLQVDVRLEGDTIFVSEYEKAPGLCKCTCLYNMECTVGPLQKKKYWIVVQSGETEVCRFQVSFNEGLDGAICF